MRARKIVVGSCILPLVFFIAQSSAQDVEWDLVAGFVGIGTGTPAAKLHVVGDGADQDAQVRVENANTAAPGVARKLFSIRNNGPAKFSIWASGSDEWAFNGRTDAFRISKQGTGRVEMEITNSGNMIIAGTLTEGSSRAIKHGIEKVDTRSLLDTVLSLPISTWSYDHDPEGIRHIGPMAEDFYAALGLGRNEKGIASLDTSGVALAAIQGMHKLLLDSSGELAQVKRENQHLRAELSKYAERMTRIELALSTLLGGQSSIEQL